MLAIVFFDSFILFVNDVFVINLFFSKMPACCVPKCPNLRKKVNCGLFVFPKDPNLRQKWLDILKMKATIISETNRVCYLHFDKDCYFKFSTRFKLKPNTLPRSTIADDKSGFSPNLTGKPLALKQDLPNYVPSPKIHEIDRKQIQKAPIKTPKQIAKPQFRIERFMQNNKKIFYYTGIESFEILTLIYNFVMKNEPENGRKHTLTPLNQFFLTLIKLKRGTDHEMLANMFEIPSKAVSSILSTWIKLLHVKLGDINDVCPHFLENSDDDFKTEYPWVISNMDLIEMISNENMEKR